MSTPKERIEGMVKTIARGEDEEMRWFSMRKGIDTAKISRLCVSVPGEKAKKMPAFACEIYYVISRLLRVIELIFHFVVLLTERFYFRPQPE